MRNVVFELVSLYLNLSYLVLYLCHYIYLSASQQLLLIRVDCKFEEGDGGGISLTTDNILHYLGVIEEKTMEIVSKYESTKKVSKHNNSFGKEFPLTGLEARPIGGATKPPLVNPPRLLDYNTDSGDDESDEGNLKPVHRSAVNYNKISSRVTAYGALPRRKTMGRRGSSMFVPPPRTRASMLS